MKRAALAIVSAFVVALLISAPVDADTHPPFQAPFSDNSTVTYGSIEGTNADYLSMNHYVYYVMEGQYDSRTVLTVQPPLARASTAGTNDDYYWYGADASLFSSPTVGASWQCMAYVSGSSSKCNRSRIRSNEDNWYTTTEARRWNRWCHEIGHGVGFRDGGNTALGCMDGASNGILSSYEIGKINDRY